MRQMALSGTITWDTTRIQASLSRREGKRGSQHACKHTDPYLGAAAPADHNIAMHSPARQDDVAAQAEKANGEAEGSELNPQAP